YSRRFAGSATRPWRSGLSSLAPPKKVRAALSSLAPRLEASRTSFATRSNSSVVYTERQPPRPFVTNAPRPSWSRYFAGRITLPLASRECWNSPRNIRIPSPFGLVRHQVRPTPPLCDPGPPLHSISWHPTPHCSTLQPTRRHFLPRRSHARFAGIG